MNRRAVYPLAMWVTWAILLPLGLIVLGFVVVASTDSETLMFDGPHLLFLGGAAPLAGLIVLYGVVRRRRALERFASGELSPLLAARLNPMKRAFRSFLVVTAILLIVAGIIGPRWGKYLEKEKVYGIDIVVALDVSRSMLAQDVAPNRLSYAKRLIRQQLTERPVFQHSHRLALLAFAGSTSLKVPLTTDHVTFRTRLEDVEVGSAPRGGTAIADAISAATDLLVRSPEEATKIILLLTDGEDHEGDPLAAAAKAWEDRGIRTYTIGVGDPARTVGVQVPSGEGAAGRPLLHDGQIVFSKLDVPGLQRIADAGKGRFAPVRDLHHLVDAIVGMRRAELSTEERIRHRPRYQWFVAVALFLLALETMISDRRTWIGDLPQRTWQQE